MILLQTEGGTKPLTEQCRYFMPLFHDPNMPTDNVVITYRDSQYPGAWNSRNSEVTCVCDKSYSGMPAFTTEGEITTNKFAFTMKHLCCCKDACKDGMPTPISKLWVVGPCLCSKGQKCILLNNTCIPIKAASRRPEKSCK